MAAFTNSISMKNYSNNDDGNLSLNIPAVLLRRDGSRAAATSKMERFVITLVAASISDQSKTSLITKLRRFYDVFATSSKSFPDVLKTFLRRLKTSPRLFLVKSKDHLDTIYGRSIYVRFKLHTYYHYILSMTN